MDEELTGLFRAIATQFQSRLRELPVGEVLNLPPFQARLVGVIGRKPGVTQLAIAAATGRDKAQVARAIAGLESRGLVHKSPHESDWRSHGLFLTEEAKRIAVAGERQRQELIAQAFAGLTESEREALRDILEKIALSLEADKA